MSETVMDRTDGQVAYEAYSAQVGGRSVHGEPLPGWAGQSVSIKAAWETAAEAVIQVFMRREIEDSHE